MPTKKATATRQTAKQPTKNRRSAPKKSVPIGKKKSKNPARKVAAHLGMWTPQMDSAVELRRNIPPERVADVSWHDTFIAYLVQVPSVQGACDAVGIPLRTAYNHRAQYPEFAERWDNCRSRVDAVIEWLLIDRALGGDLTAQIFLLKNQRTGSKNPPLYSDPAKKVEVGGIPGQPIQHNITIDGLERVPVAQLSDWIDRIERVIDVTAELVIDES